MRLLLRLAKLPVLAWLAFWVALAPVAAAAPPPTGPDAADAVEAAETFDVRLAKAQAGDARAQCEVGVAYINGTDVPQDFRQGLDWLHASSDAGFGYARFVLADLYSRGYGGVPVDDAKAYYFGTLAAASSTLPERFRERAVKLRNASAKRLSAAQLTSLQAKAALAPLDAAFGQ
ncbi:MAG: tetratricopeptide repeat protein [Solidesulfovibrio sp. DCME]|uniref:tetratricopeptide repeat protein n=1 Tax=Solidesulfovibrio sp. DCME TaxID=3447380 RepID=UPI003D0B9A45